MKPWDVAAGLLLVREAGGYATDPYGQEQNAMDMECNVVAANTGLHEKLREAVGARPGRLVRQREAMPLTV